MKALCGRGRTAQGGRALTDFSLAWLEAPDISVKVDTARLEAGQFKKCCMECVLLYYPSTEF
jgi:hypothetical protein